MDAAANLLVGTCRLMATLGRFVGCSTICTSLPKDRKLNRVREAAVGLPRRNGRHHHANRDADHATNRTTVLAADAPWLFRRTEHKRRRSEVLRGGPRRMISGRNATSPTLRATPTLEKRPSDVSNSTQADWKKPAAMAIPKEGLQGRAGPIRSHLPEDPRELAWLHHREGQARADVVREYGKNIEDTIAGLPDGLAVLRLHYLRWVLFDIGADTYFMYQGIFDTDFDKYTEDAVALFTKYGINTVFENLEGFPEDWKSNTPAFIKFVREHQHPSFLEYAEHPCESADEIKKALRLKDAFSTMLDQSQ